ncbi:hypothetical protein UFOVP49_34 [uncultured Caudovirales phage]|uniref:Uncharacterized protein n=1 Tax=uncultured Caudovirales phage TaxID=2100421 RepID=A0A6J5KP69_9CAUD|nr:hypothetical protein UFOVP49_34 [uncultured Caudovirales phage]
MNIFFLDQNPRLAAEMHCDKHVVKMILESAQLLSTAHRVLDGQMTMGKSKSGRNAKRWVLNDSRETILYQASHINHPSACWVRSNIDHYRWVYDLMFSLIGEYKYRYSDRQHKCETLLMPLLDSPINIPIIDWADLPLAMPDDVKVEGNPVESYRQYYINRKKDIARWTRRPQPDWWI